MNERMDLKKGMIEWKREERRVEGGRRGGERREKEERADLHRAAPQRRVCPVSLSPAPRPKGRGNLTAAPPAGLELREPLTGAWTAGLGRGGRWLRQALGLVFNYCIKHLLCHSRSDSILPLRYLILLPSREKAKQVFVLICTLNILVIKQHLRKPIVKSILIGTKISQVVELQLREGVSGASGHRVLRSQQGEQLGEQTSVFPSLSLSFLIC